MHASRYSHAGDPSNVDPMRPPSPQQQLTPQSAESTRGARGRRRHRRMLNKAMFSHCFSTWSLQVIVAIHCVMQRRRMTSSGRRLKQPSIRSWQTHTGLGDFYGSKPTIVDRLGFSLVISSRLTRVLNVGLLFNLLRSTSHVTSFTITLQSGRTVFDIS